MVQFYIFKANAKKCLPQNSMEILVHQLYDFTSKHKDQVFDLKSSENEFSISVEKAVDINEEYDEVMYMEMDDNENVQVAEEENSQEAQFAPLDITKLEDFKQEIVNEEDLVTEVPDDNENIIELNDRNHYVTCECGETFKDIKELQAHTATAHKKKVSSGHANLNYPTCCGVQFKEIKYLTMHENAHESFNAVLSYLPWFQCEECKIHYSNEKDLQTHFSVHESGTLSDSIDLIPRPSAFEDHFKQKIFDETDEVSDGWVCGHCGIKKSEIDMKIHLLFFHTMSIECPIENRVFEGNKQIRLFIVHLKNKHPEIFDKAVEYICTYCNANFPSMFERLAHMKICDSKKFICTSHCGKRFKTEWLLNRHIQVIQDGDDRFRCSLCNKSCLSKSDLQIHMRSHTNERPYVCSICDKAFKTSANRSSHMDIHREEKVHECNICLEKFQTRPILRKHKKKHDLEYQSQCVS